MELPIISMFEETRKMSTARLKMCLWDIDGAYLVTVVTQPNDRNEICDGAMVAFDNLTDAENYLIEEWDADIPREKEPDDDWRDYGPD